MEKACFCAPLIPLWVEHWWRLIICAWYRTARLWPARPLRNRKEAYRLLTNWQSIQKKLTAFIKLKIWRHHRWNGRGLEWAARKKKVASPPGCGGVGCTRIPMPAPKSAAMIYVLADQENTLSRSVTRWIPLSPQMKVAACGLSRIIKMPWKIIYNFMSFEQPKLSDPDLKMASERKRMMKTSTQHLEYVKDAQKSTKSPVGSWLVISRKKWAILFGRRYCEAYLKSIKSFAGRFGWGAPGQKIRLYLRRRKSTEKGTKS